MLTKCRVVITMKNFYKIVMLVAVIFAKSAYAPKRGPPKARTMQCDAKNLIITDSSGTISYPSPPGKYKKDQRCVWRFDIPPHHGLVVRFRKLDIEESCKDYLQMPDGYRVCGKQVPFQCYAYHGTSTPICSPLQQRCDAISVHDTILQQLSHPTITFASDGKNEFRGFELDYYVVNCQPTKPTTKPVTTRTTAKQLPSTKPPPTSSKTFLSPEPRKPTKPRKTTNAAPVTTTVSPQTSNNTDLIIALVVVLVILIALAITVMCLLWRRQKRKHKEDTDKDGLEMNRDDIYSVVDDEAMRQRRNIAERREEEAYAECGPPPNYGMVDNRLYHDTALKSTERQIVNNELYRPMPNGGMKYEIQ